MQNSYKVQIEATKIHLMPVIMTGYGCEIFSEFEAAKLLNTGVIEFRELHDYYRQQAEQLVEDLIKERTQ